LVKFRCGGNERIDRRSEGYDVLYYIGFDNCFDFILPCKNIFSAVLKLYNRVIKWK